MDITNSFRYRFSFGGDEDIILDAEFDPDTLHYIRPEKETIPNWTKFDYWPCDECVEQSKKSDYCPVAANIAEIADKFTNCNSYDVVDVRVEGPDRTYLKNGISLQRALSSLIGIIIISSRCQDLHKLRPLVRFHLPFETVDETIYRAASMYYLAQYFRNQRNKEPKWDIEELKELYDRFILLTDNLSRRLQVEARKDATFSAVGLTAQIAPLITEKRIKELEILFSGYLE